MTVQSYVPLLLDRLDTPHGLLQTYACQHWFFVAPESRAQQQGHALIPWQESPQRGLRTCPLCLRHDPRPYRRLYWRLSWMSSCPDHGMLLEESPGSLVGREARRRRRPSARILTSCSLTISCCRRSRGGRSCSPMAIACMGVAGCAWYVLSLTSCASRCKRPNRRVPRCTSFGPGMTWRIAKG
jgi:hypothetical protein